MTKRGAEGYTDLSIHDIWALQVANCDRLINEAIFGSDHFDNLSNLEIDFDKYLFDFLLKEKLDAANQYCRKAKENYEELVNQLDSGAKSNGISIWKVLGWLLGFALGYFVIY